MRGGSTSSSFRFDYASVASRLTIKIRQARHTDRRVNSPFRLSVSDLKD